MNVDHQPFTCKVRVSMGYVDPAGLIFFPRLYDLCEIAFEQFFEACFKTDFAATLVIEKRGAIVVHSEADYQKAIRLGDTLTIAVACTRLGHTSLTLEFTFDNQHAERVAIARTVHVLMDLKRYVKMPIPATWQHLLHR